MRLLLLALVLPALAGCQDRRTFDERFKDTGEQLEQKARELDRNIAQELPAEGEGNTGE